MASDKEQQKVLRHSWKQSALPAVPVMKGWHVCWLLTTNSYDSIDKRIRLGYVPVKADELPEMQNYRVKAGEHEGYVACNKMLLYKIPIELHQEIMSHFHRES